ncbi:putative leader peptide [Streptomyces sp. NPDC056470]
MRHVTALHTLDRDDRRSPLLTSRRHIDLGRTSSALCRPA